VVFLNLKIIFLYRAESYFIYVHIDYFHIFLIWLKLRINIKGLKSSLTLKTNFSSLVKTKPINKYEFTDSFVIRKQDTSNKNYGILHEIKEKFNKILYEKYIKPFIIESEKDNEINNNNNINNENNDINEIIQEEPREEEYSYDCTNSMYLTVYIYEGTEDAEFEIFLRNNGTKTWAEDSKLINDPSSFLKTDVILLAQQKPNEERGYKTVIKNLGRYADGEYKVIYLFYTEGKIRGEKITAIVKIKEKDNKKSEVEENMEKINEFRDTFNLSEEEYSNEKIFEILKDNDFNFESAFSSLFN
jgi:hypothetical protein